MVRSSVILFFLMTLGYAAFAAKESVSLHYQVVNNFPVKYIAVNMNDPEVVVTTAVARSFPYGLESWSGFLGRLRPDAAINGTYFCPQSAQPVGDVAVDGALMYRGCVGTAFCVTPNNRVDFLPGPLQAKSNWQGYRTVLCAGPRLLAGGRVSIDARSEGFRDPHVLGSAPRSALALRADNVLLLLTIQKKISLQNLAWVCQKLGAVEAITLDGGSSSGLYAGGRTVTKPSRSISNIIAVYSTPQRFTQAYRQLVPGNRPVLARLLEQPVFAENAFDFTPVLNTVSTAKSSPPSLVKILEPAAAKQLQGIVPIKVRIGKTVPLGLCTLRINGELCAMTNTPSLEFHWDSTKVQDGKHLLEVSVFSQDKNLLALESREVQVKNTARIAAN